MNNFEDNIPEYTVTEFNNIFNETIKTAFNLIKIRGEISSLKKHYSGHFYFVLKDENSIINVVCWKTNVSKINFNLEEGLEVIARGRISAYAKSISVYQLNVDNITIAGEGALLKLIEDRKKKLEKKGLFDVDKKKSLPLIPNEIGIITSPTGSVLKDILHRVKERFPRKIQLWPTPVQGKEAAKKMIEAINGFNNVSYENKPDVIIIARGGGSIEDLMPFNDENLAIAVYNSNIPIISAVGHETDNPIIDFVSDLRAPTPSAAAEKCVPVRNDLIKLLSNIINNLNMNNKKIVEYNKDKTNKLFRLLQEPKSAIIYYYSQLNNLTNKKNFLIHTKIIKSNNKLNNQILNKRLPMNKIKNEKLILNNLVNIFYNSMNLNIIKNKNKFKNIMILLNSSSIDKILKKGYAIIRQNGKIVTKAKKILLNKRIEIQFVDGKIFAKENKS